jgi:hypothetical protein
LECPAGSFTFWIRGSAERLLFCTDRVLQGTILDFSPLGADIVEISKSLAGVKGFSTLYRNITDNADGDAVMTLTSGGTIALDSVSRARLGYGNILLV